MKIPVDFTGEDSTFPHRNPPQSSDRSLSETNQPGSYRVERWRCSFPPTRPSEPSKRSRAGFSILLRPRIYISNFTRPRGNRKDSKRRKTIPVSFLDSTCSPLPLPPFFFFYTEPVRSSMANWTWNFISPDERSTGYRKGRKEKLSGRMQYSGGL